MLKKTLIAAATILLLSLQANAQAPLKLSVQFLEAVKNDRDPSATITKLANLDAENLAENLATDAEKKTFWINVYNATVQYKLKRNPELFEDRDAFFGEDRMTIAGEKISLDLMEHGILRHSKNKLSKGYLNKIFVSDYEKMMRVEEVDPRIHFVLNCGATSCPPVRILRYATFEQQMERATRQFLQNTTEVKEDEVHVTRLMSWFSNDFGATIPFLKKYDALPEDSTIDDVEFKEYDWTMKLDYYAN